MMDAEEQERNRRAPGERTAAHFTVRVTWVPGAGEEAVAEASGKMINVSPAGVLLMLDHSPRAGEDVFLHVAPGGEREVAEDNQVSFAAWTLWTSEETPGAGYKAAFELDFSGDLGQEHMRRWMELIYEPMALTQALEGE
ncbi:MAG TPA: hypothetical protein VM870_00955 [Pyrinomonadaceae bacterium]|jgi:hypothetical protein|nr:hypothetical protein [Pyrinomonadaceae bacterium]